MMLVGGKVMGKSSISEKLVIDEVTKASVQLRSALRGMPIGTLVRSIRTQLGMSQATLAKRSGVPQPTISRIEHGQENFELSTLRKILRAMSFDLILAPVSEGSINSIREDQAKKNAQKRVQYLSGTMNLEQQHPDPKFIESLLKQEMERLFHGSGKQLWEE